MDNGGKIKIEITRVNETEVSRVEDIVASELPLTIFLNNKELVTMLCTPEHMEQLTVGFLSSEGLLDGIDDIKSMVIDEKRGIARAETHKEMEGEIVFKRFISSGCGRGASFYSAADVSGQPPIESNLRVSASSIFALSRKFHQSSELFQATGGVHSAALCRGEEIIAFDEDIGRHNAVDKIFGHCLMEGISIEDAFVITSGRISSEILLKVVRRGIPLLISRSAPTELGARLADNLGVTLIGFVRGRRMNIYSHSERITTVE